MRALILAAAALLAAPAHAWYVCHVAPDTDGDGVDNPCGTTAPTVIQPHPG
ncbi:MAG: hypothetical protein R3F60_18800 [bacterium]